MAILSVVTALVQGVFHDYSKTFLLAYNSHQGFTRDTVSTRLRKGWVVAFIRIQAQDILGTPPGNVVVVLLHKRRTITNINKFRILRAKVTSDFAFIREVVDQN